MTKRQPPDPVGLTGEDKLRHYTPEEIIELKLLPGSVRSLRDAAYGQRIPHTKIFNKIVFRLDHILAISMAGDVDPVTRGRRAA